jgi:hypothetical protein
MFGNEEVEGTIFFVENGLGLTKGIAYNKIITCTNIIDLRNIGSYLYKIKCKWENTIRNLSSEVGSRTIVIS